LGFSGARFFSAELGQAAAAKMCRSVVIKGMEALLTEALLTARHFGVEDQVIASLENLLPRPDWPQHARYMISRSLLHGMRRAEEMGEAAFTVREAGLDPLMSTACAARQEWAARYAAALQHEELADLLDAIHGGIQTQQHRTLNA
jgi:3-hydroxyisobutyrate dehydrogenase-like beta-hydroxyacid dehydrogenase